MLDEILKTMKLQNLILLLTVILLSYLIYKNLNNIILYFKSNDEIIIKLHEWYAITILKSYFEYYPDIIKNDVELIHGNLDIILEGIAYYQRRDSIKYFIEKRVCHSKLNTKIYFEDYNLNISGYIIWKSRKYENNVEIGNKSIIMSKINYFYPVINIKLNEKSKIKFGCEYFNKIKNIVECYESKGNKLYYSILLNIGRYIDSISYKMHIKDEKETQEQCDKIWIDSFFSNAKDAVWDHVKKIHYEPEKIKRYGQTPRASYIFHGESGTGKSSFVTRMAISLKRHIVSLDLREIRTKKDIDEILDGIFISQIGYQKRNKCIFLLDDFDLVLRSLVFKDKLKKKYYENLFSNKNNEKDNVKINKNKFDDINECDFTVSDLVEIFQGSYPLDGLILIAITNDFDEIKKLCPKLFRDNRMTPIEFKKMDIITLNQLSEEYFNKKLEFTFNGTINNPTSAIIELAMLHIDNFDNFNKALKETIREKIIL